MIALDVPRMLGVGLLATALLTRAHIASAARALHIAGEQEDARRARVLGFGI
jgi:hypothetical protein